jgi:hypothetical protein
MRINMMLTMSPVGLAQWKIALADLAIGNGSDLWREVNGAREQQDHVISLPPARDAFDGKASKNKWEIIFRELDLKWSDFFTEAAWNGWNQETLWGMLFNLAEDASDRFGIVLPQKLEHAGFEDMFTSQKIQKTIPTGKSVLLEIPEGLSGYAIVLEQGVSGNIVLVAPSCLMKDSAVKGEVLLLPQYPPSPFKFLVPTTVGINYLWAGIFAQLPDWEWLHEDRQGLLKLEVAHVTQLIEYAEAQPRNTIQIWSSSYTVTAA